MDDGEAQMMRWLDAFGQGWGGRIKPHVAEEYDLRSAMTWHGGLSENASNVPSI